MRPPTQRGLQDKEQTPCGGPGSPAHTAWETRLRRARSQEHGDGHASCPTRTLWDGPPKAERRRPRATHAWHASHASHADPYRSGAAAPGRRRSTPYTPTGRALPPRGRRCPGRPQLPKRGEKREPSGPSARGARPEAAPVLGADGAGGGRSRTPRSSCPQCGTWTHSSL